MHNIGTNVVFVTLFTSAASIKEVYSGLVCQSTLFCTGLIFHGKLLCAGVNHAINILQPTYSSFDVGWEIDEGHIINYVAVTKYPAPYVDPFCCLIDTTI